MLAQIKPIEEDPLYKKLLKLGDGVKSLGQCGK